MKFEYLSSLGASARKVYVSNGIDSINNLRMTSKLRQDEAANTQPSIDNLVSPGYDCKFGNSRRYTLTPYRFSARRYS